MLNRLVNAQFNLAEEDRLTNAFMLVLADADWSVQQDILSSMGVPQACLTMEDELRIDLQTAFS